MLKSNLLHIPYQTIALAIALAIGGGIGYYFCSNVKNKEIKKLTEQHVIDLKKEIGLEKDRIAKLNVQIDGLKVQRVSDSVQLEKLSRDMKKHEELVEKQRRDAAKMTPDEKKKFILDYYSNTDHNP